LKTKIGSEMEGVKRELDELRHYEDLKQNIDNDIQKQKREYLDLIDNARSEIKFEHDKYSSLLKDIGVEKDSLIKDKKEILQLEEKEDHLRKRLEAIYGIIKNIESQIGDKRHDIGDAEVHITKLISLAESVEKAIREKKEDVITPLIKKSEEQADKISIVQDSILLKIKNKEMRINSFSEESKKLSEKFTKFFDKKMRIEQLLKKIDDDKHSMESQLRILIKTAQAFDIIAKKTDAKKYMDELVKTYDQIDEKRNLLKKKITQLSSIVRGN
jgi:chromosome segregation ATPase